MGSCCSAFEHDDEHDNEICLRVIGSTRRLNPEDMDSTIDRTLEYLLAKLRELKISKLQLVFDGDKPAYDGFTYVVAKLMKILTDLGITVSIHLYFLDRDPESKDEKMEGTIEKWKAFEVDGAKLGEVMKDLGSKIHINFVEGVNDDTPNKYYVLAMRVSYEINIFPHLCLVVGGGRVTFEELEQPWENRQYMLTGIQCTDRKRSADQNELLKKIGNLSGTVDLSLGPKN